MDTFALVGTTSHHPARKMTIEMQFHVIGNLLQTYLLMRFSLARHNAAVYWRKDPILLNFQIYIVSVD
jgi:hypothetical protein